MFAQQYDRAGEFLEARFFGKYPGEVTDNADPEKRGRVKVRVRSVLEAAEIWALPCVPYAGKGVGLYLIPDPGTAVWVEFAAGDPSCPIWTGCFWADGEVPGAPDPAVKVLRTTKGTIEIDDTEDVITMANDRDSTLILGDTAALAAAAGGATATHTVGGTGVKSDSGGGAVVEANGAGVSVNNGALTVG
jgi:uncharacterized protein involved in type VI secretion and phage assembly